jgi:transcriptional regulator with XRE-family HTH domain
MTATQDQPHFERRSDGGWVYEGTAITVPGARTQTLRDAVKPRELGRPGEEPQAVVFSLSEIVANPRLNWVLQSGTRLRGGEEDMFSIAWDSWLRRAEHESGVWAPERDASGIVRRLAIDEREVRFARDALERALETRSRRVVLASLLGMSRRQVGELLGVSPTRVQQLLEDVPQMDRHALEQLAADARAVLDALPDGPVARNAIALPPGWKRSQLERLLDKLAEHGLVEQDLSTGTVQAAGWSSFRGKRLRVIPSSRAGAATHG